MFHFLFKEREAQLNDKERIDNHLKEINTKEGCSSLVTDYLLLQRNITRNQQFKLMKSDLFSIKKNLTKEMELHHSIHSSFQEKIKDEMNILEKCEKLKEVIFNNE